MKKKSMLIFFGLILIYVVSLIIVFGYYVKKGGKLSKTVYTENLKLGDNSNPEFKVFIGGDSIATGVGANSFEKSTAGRLANYLAKNNKVTLINEAENGAKMIDVLNGKGPQERQDLIILIVSSNDLLRLTNLKNFEDATKKVLEKYSKLADKLIIAGPGRVFHPSIIPIPLRFIYKLKAPEYASIIAEEARKYPNVVHISPLKPPVDFSKYEDVYSSDRFHPNDEGHRLWFDMIKTVLWA